MVREDVDADVEVAKPKFGTPGHPQSLLDEPRGPAPSEMYKKARLGSEAYVIMVSLTKEEFQQVPDFEGREPKECKMEQSQSLLAPFGGGTNQYVLRDNPAIPADIGIRFKVAQALELHDREFALRQQDAGLWDSQRDEMWGFMASASGGEDKAFAALRHAAKNTVASIKEGMIAYAKDKEKSLGLSAEKQQATQDREDAAHVVAVAENDLASYAVNPDQVGLNLSLIHI